jgi:hypothetical protein
MLLNLSRRGAGSNGSNARASASSTTTSIRWIRHAVVLVIVLYVAMNLAARSPFGERLLHPQQDKAAVGAPWQLLAALAPPSAGEDDGATTGSSNPQHNAAAEARATDDARRPAAFDQCGVWQEAYMERHRRILAGELPERYVVAVLHDAGVADQLLGVVTAFYWALVSQSVSRIGRSVGRGAVRVGESDGQMH